MYFLAATSSSVFHRGLALSSLSRLSDVSQAYRVAKHVYMVFTDVAVSFAWPQTDGGHLFHTTSLFRPGIVLEDCFMLSADEQIMSVDKNVT